MECQAARDILAKEYGAKPQGEPHSKFVLDSLVRTILSQNTTDLTSARAFAGLKARNATWEKFLTCSDEDCEESVRCGGLAEIKVQRIKTILRTLKKERGDLSLEYVRSMGDEEVKKELGRFKGVGPKTISCVMMFTLQRAEFPVDTHVSCPPAHFPFLGHFEISLNSNAFVPPGLEDCVEAWLGPEGGHTRDKL
jgi:endonuclease-3